MKKYLSLILCLLLVMNTLVPAMAAGFTLPAGLEVIEEEAFSNVPITGVMEVSGNVTAVNDGAFSGTQITALVIGEGVETVGSDIAKGSDAVYVVIEGEDTEVASDAFDSIPFVIAASEEQAGGAEFCPADDVVCVDGFFYQTNDDGTAELLFAEDPSAVGGEVTVPEEVEGFTVIGVSEYAFVNCEDVESVTLPDTVENMPSTDNWPSDITVTGSAPMIPDEDVGAVEMEMAADEITLLVGGESCIIPMPGEFPDGLQQFYSSNEKVARVTQDGRIIPVGLGTSSVTVYIRAEDNLYYGVVRVHVVEPEAEYIFLGLADDDKLHVVMGESTNIRYIVENNFGMDDNTVTALTRYESADDSIVKVDEYGFITAESAGETTVTLAAVITDDFTVEGTVAVVVEEGIAFDSNSIYGYCGNDYYLKVLNLPEGAECEWSVEDEEIIPMEFATDEEGNLLRDTAILHFGWTEEPVYPSVYCTVTDAEGEVIAELSCLTHIMPYEFYLTGEDGWEFRVFPSDIFDFEELTGIRPEVSRWWFDNDEPIEVVWESSNESIISFEGSVATIHDVEFEEWVEVVCRASTQGREEERRINVQVRKAELYANFDTDWVEMEVGHITGIGYGYDHEARVISTSFESMDESIATIDVHGQIRAHKAGETDIVYRVEDVTGNVSEAWAHVFVHGSEASVRLIPEEAVMNVGESNQMAVEFDLPEDVYVRGYDFYSEDEGIVSVDGYNIYANAPGTVGIHYNAYLTDDTFVPAVSYITVVDAASPLKLDVNSMVMELYDSYKLTATFDGVDVSADAEWSTEDEDLLRVVGGGWFVLMNSWDHEHVAHVDCTYTVDGVEYTARCAVRSLPQKFRLEGMPGMLQMSAGDVQGHAVTVVNNTGEDYRLEWFSRDTNIAVIEGVKNTAFTITGVSAGKTTVFCTAYTESGRVLDELACEVYVDTPFENPTGISYTQDHYVYILEEGEWLPDWCLPEIILEGGNDYTYGRLRVHSDNPELIDFDEGWPIYNFGTGEANLTAFVAGYPELTAETKVTITRGELVCDAEDDQLRSGDVVTFTFEGIPEDFEYQSLDWEYDQTHFYELSRDRDSITLIACYEGDPWVSVDLKLYENLHVRSDKQVWIHGSEFNFDMDLLMLNTGEGWEMGTQFEYDLENWTFASSDESVVKVEAWQDEHGIHNGIEAVGEGYAYITLSSEWGEARAMVVVSDEPMFDLIDFNLPSVLYMGMGYDASVAADFNSNHWPEITIVSENPDVARVEEREDGSLELVLVKPGTVRLTASAVKKDDNGKVLVKDSITREFTVVAPAVYMNERYPWMDIGETFQLEVINTTDKVIKSIEWSSTDDSIAEVDENGLLRMVGDPDRHGTAVELVVSAKVTFEDDTVAYALCYPYINRYIHITHHEGDSYIEMRENGMPGSTHLGVYFESSVRPEDLYFWWNTHDERIALIGDQDWQLLGTEQDENGEDCYYYYYCDAYVFGDRIGWATVSFHAETMIDGHAGEMADYYIDVEVANPYFNIDEIELNTPSDFSHYEGDRVGMPVENIKLGVGYEEWIELPEEANDAIVHFYSSDENIAVVGQNGRVTGVGAGNAAITVVMRRNDGWVCYGVVGVQVVSPQVDMIIGNLNEDGVLEMTVGETHILAFGMDANIPIGGYEIGGMSTLTSQNEDIIVIGDNQYFTAVGAGETTVTMTTKITDDYIIDTVIPVSVTEGAMIIDHCAVRIYDGEQVQLNVLNLPEGATCEWFTENEGFANVDENGLVTAAEGVEASVGIYCNVFDAEGNLLTEEPLSCRVNIFPISLVFEDRGEEEFSVYMIGEFNFFEHYEIVPAAYGWYYDYDPEIKVWCESSDPSVISIAEDGVTCKTNIPGECVITCHIEALGRTAGKEYLIRVQEGYVHAELHGDCFDIDVGDSYHIGYDFGADFHVESVAFESSDPGVFTVNAEGRITGVDRGEATLTLTVTDYAGTTATASAQVRVYRSKVYLHPETAVINVGEMIQFVPEYIDYGDGANVRHSDMHVHNNDIADMHDHFVYGKAEGTTYVQFDTHFDNDTDAHAVSLITVVDPDNALKLNENLVVLQPYHTVQLEATFNGEAVTGAVWTSSDPEFASVDDNGLVTMNDCWDTEHIAAITCTYTVDDEEYTAVCSVKGEYQKYRIIGLPEYIKINTGDSRYLIAGLETDGGNIDDVTFEWSVIAPEGEEALEPVVSIEDGKVIGVASGIAEILCKAVDAEGNVLDCRTLTIYVNIPSDVDAEIAFDQESYLILMADDDFIHEWMQPRVELNTAFGDLYDRIEYYIEDGSAAFYDGDWLHWTGEEGTVTIGAYVRGYPEMRTSAEVTIRRMEMHSSAEEVMQGEAFTMVVTGIPADVELAEANWEADDNWARLIESGRDEESGEYYATFAANGEWYDEVRFYCRLENGNDFELRSGVQLNWTEFRFERRSIVLNPGDEYEIWPEFGYDPNEWHWETSDESIAVGETVFEGEDGEHRFVITANDIGLAQLSFVHNEDENMRAVITVSVTEPAWELKEIHIPNAVILGESYSLDAWVESSGEIWPEMTWESEDPEIFEIRQEEWRAVANAVGTATVTLTCEKNGETQSISKEITVTEPAFRIDDPYPSLRAGQSFEINLIVREDMADQIESINWVSTCEDAATVAAAEDDPCKATITFSDWYFDEHEEYDIYVIANINLKDGSTAFAYCTPDLITMHDLYFDMHHIDQDIWMGLADYGNPKTTTLYAWFSTNMIQDEEYRIEVEYPDANIVNVTDIRIIHEGGESYRMEVDLEAVSEDDAYMWFGFMDNDLEHPDFEHGRGVNIRVNNPQFEICSDQSGLTIGTGETRRLNCWYDTMDTDGHGYWSPYVWESSDTAIAVVDCHGNVTGIKPGSVKITHTVYSNGQVPMGSFEFDVTVLGVTLSETELTLNPGETADISFSYDENEGEVTGWAWESLNESVAIVSSDSEGNGAVVAVAPGTAVIRLGTDFIDSNDEYHAAWGYCTVTVPYPEDAALKLSETDLVLPSEQTAKLEYTLAEGIEADSVEWFSGNSDIADIDQEGSIRVAYNEGEKMFTNVGVKVTAGENVYEATCLVTVTPANYRIGSFSGMWGTHVGGEHNINLDDHVNGNYVASKYFVSEDEDIAVVRYYEDGNPYILGVGQGITDIHCIVELDNGEVYTSTVTMYVETEFPEIEEFHTVETLYMTAPAMDCHLTWRYLPWWTTPEGIPVEVTYQVPEDAEQGIINVYEDGNIEALQPGTTRMNITVHGYPELCTGVEVVVLDDIYTVVGSENDVYRPSDQVQLSVENWDGPVRYRCYYDGNQVSVSEDGVLTVLDPCDEVYDLYAYMDLDGEELEIRYEFRIEGMLNNSDEAYYAVNNYAVAYPDQLGEMDMRVSEALSSQISYETLESQTSDIAVIEDERFIRTLQPGEAHIVRRAYNENGEEIASLDFYFTVQEDVAPELSFHGARIFKVGETLGIWPEVHNGSYFGIDWDFESSDENILRYNDFDEGWQTYTFTGMQEGVVDVTLYAKFSENGQVGSVTMPVYVIPAE